jgi:hypothetical protein
MNIIIDYNQICLSPLTDSIVNILITLLFCYITKYFSSFSLQDGVAPGGNRPRPDHSRPGAELLGVVGDFDLKKKGCRPSFLSQSRTATSRSGSGKTVLRRGREDTQEPSGHRKGEAKGVQKPVGPEGGHPIEAAHSEAGGELDEAAECCTDEDEVLELLCELVELGELPRFGF